MWGSGLTARVGAGSAETFVGSGDIDVAQMQLCSGDTALDFEPIPFGDTFRLVRRYLRTSYDYPTLVGASSQLGCLSHEITWTTANSYELIDHVRYDGVMRTNGTAYLYSTTGAGGTGSSGKVRNATGGADLTVVLDSVGRTGFIGYFNNQSVTAGHDILYHYVHDSRY
jgi:hypothetical protein